MKKKVNIYLKHQKFIINIVFMLTFNKLSIFSEKILIKTV